MTFPSNWFIHTVQVETVGTNASFETVYAAPVDVACLVEEKTLVEQQARGDVVASSARVFAALSDFAKFTPDSKVTYTDGRQAKVITTARFDVAGLGMSIPHIEVDLGPTIQGFYQENI